MTDGLIKDGAALNITQITAAQMKAGTDALIGADKAFNTSRSGQEKAYENFHAADDALTTWLGKATGTLSAFFGKRWNRQWVQVGFIAPSIAIPSTITERLALSLRVINFLAANPTYEAPNQGVTAATGKAARDAAISTQTLASQADADLSVKGTARTAASDALTSSMRLLVGVLAELLNADDTRWLDFGLSIPASISTPGAPLGLSASANPTQQGVKGTGDDATVSVLLTCDATPFASRYRFRMRVLGVQTDYELVASTTEPMASIDVPANAAVEIIVQAVNGSRQSVPSDPVIYDPMARKAPVASAPATLEHAAVPAAPANGTNGDHTPANGARVSTRG
jgi:hypothetical protein